MLLTRRTNNVKARIFLKVKNLTCIMQPLYHLITAKGVFDLKWRCANRSVCDREQMELYFYDNYDMA